MKRSLSLSGHRTSLSVEAEFWDALKTIAREQNRPLAALLNEIDAARAATNLSSAARLYVLRHLQKKADPDSQGPL